MWLDNGNNTVRFGGFLVGFFVIRQHVKQFEHKKSRLSGDLGENLGVTLNTYKHPIFQGTYTRFSRPIQLTQCGGFWGLSGALLGNHWWNFGGFNNSPIPPRVHQRGVNRRAR